MVANKKEMVMLKNVLLLMLLVFSAGCLNDEYTIPDSDDTLPENLEVVHTSEVKLLGTVQVNSYATVTLSQGQDVDVRIAKIDEGETIILVDSVSYGTDTIGGYEINSLNGKSVEVKGVFVSDYKKFRADSGIVSSDDPRGQVILVERLSIL